MKNQLSILLIASLSLPVLAQSADRSAIIADRAAVAAAADQRNATLQSLGRGATLTSNEQEYQVLPGARAVQSQPQETQQQAVARVGGGQAIESKGNFVVYSTPQQGGASVAQVRGVTTYPAVLNTRSGNIGILPGTIRVKLKDATSAAAIASDKGLTLAGQLAHLQMAVYRVKAGQDLAAAAASLAADVRVVSAEVEVLEHMNVPH
jgi:hypothetical protein